LPGLPAGLFLLLQVRTAMELKLTISIGEPSPHGAKEKRVPAIMLEPFYCANLLYVLYVTLQLNSGLSKATHCIGILVLSWLVPGIQSIKGDTKTSALHFVISVYSFT
jgi:hypothetical protein